MKIGVRPEKNITNETGQKLEGNVWVKGLKPSEKSPVNDSSEVRTEPDPAIEKANKLKETHKPLKKEGFLKGVWEGLKSDFNIGKMKTTAEKILRPLTTGGAGLVTFAAGNAVLSPFIGPLAQPVSLGLAALAGYAGHKLGGVINSFSKDNNNTKRAEQVLKDLTADKPSGEYNINDFTRLLDKNDVSGKGILSAIVRKLSGGTKRSQADFTAKLNEFNIDPTNSNHSQVLQALAQRGYKIPEDKLTGLNGHTILLNAAKNASSGIAKDINNQLSKIELGDDDKKTAFAQALSIGNPNEAIRLAKQLSAGDTGKLFSSIDTITKGTKRDVLLKMMDKDNKDDLLNHLGECLPEDGKELDGAIKSKLFDLTPEKASKLSKVVESLKTEKDQWVKKIFRGVSTVTQYIRSSTFAKGVLSAGSLGLAGTIGTLIGGPAGTVLGPIIVATLLYGGNRLMEYIDGQSGITDEEKKKIEKQIKGAEEVLKEVNVDVFNEGEKAGKMPFDNKEE